MNHQPAPDDRTPRLIRKPFLLVRLIIFLILAFLNILILAFSAWNVTAARTSGYDGPFGASFALFNSCMFMFLGILAFADVVFPCATTSVLKFELGWIGVLSVFNFAASIIATRDGPQLMCQPGVEASVCTSSILLLPVSWFASLLIFSYFTILMVLTAIHMQMYPNVYNVPITLIPWFESYHAPYLKELTPAQHSQENHLRLFEPESDHGHCEVDIEKHSIPCYPIPRDASARMKIEETMDSLSKKRPSVFSVASFTPQWAKALNGKTKRGINNPFGLPARPPLLPNHLGVRTGDEARDGNPERLSYWLGRDVEWDTVVAPQDARPNYHVGEGLFEVDRSKTTLPPLRPLSPLSDTGTSTTSREEKRMGVIIGGDDLGRKSVSSMFPRSVKEEDWNQPVKKPPFRDGRGEGWCTADNSIGAKGRGRRL